MPELEARLQLRPLEEKVRGYLHALDSALDVLSHGREGLLPKLPPWCLTARQVRLGVNRDGRGVVVRIVPRPDIAEDAVALEEIETEPQLADIMQPWKPKFPPERLSHVGFVLFGPVQMISQHDPLKAPLLRERGSIGYGKLCEALNAYTLEAAQRDALEFWNGAMTNLPPGQSFIAFTSSVFDRCSASIRRKGFVERRIHRLIHDHATTLLPEHTRLLYEHPLHFGAEVRRADFILERGIGLPAFLIELESPAYNVLRADGQLTEQANHARAQIAEWVAFIDQDAQRNASGELAFLAGPKQRLVIMGRGTADREVLLQQRFTDTTFWTYDLMLEQARQRWNGILEAQCRDIGRPPLRPF